MPFLSLFHAYHIHFPLPSLGPPSFITFGQIRTWCLHFMTVDYWHILCSMRIFLFFTGFCLVFYVPVISLSLNTMKLSLIWPNIPVGLSFPFFSFLNQFFFFFPWRCSSKSQLQSELVTWASTELPSWNACHHHSAFSLCRPPLLSLCCLFQSLFVGAHPLGVS